MSNAKAFGSKFIKEIKVIKIYFSICFSILFIGVSAQQVGKQNFQLKNTLNNPPSYRANNHNSINSLTCDTITTMTRKDTLTLYSVISSSAALSGGYVTGNNHYGDSAIATYIPIDTSLMPSGTQISGVKAVFYRYGTMGTKGTQTITLNIFTGDTIHGPTTTTAVVGTNTVVSIAPPIGTATASLAAISAIAPVINAVDSAVIPLLSANYQIPYLFSFASPITVPDTGFFISLTLPTTAGDTVVLLCSRNDSSHVNYAWDFGINGWRAYSNSNDWTLYTSLTLFPVICYQPAGIEQITSSNQQVTIYPNPAKNILTIEGLLRNENTTLQITDMFGAIYSTFKTQHSRYTLNLVDLDVGVYFITITNSKYNPITKKLIIE